jgi:hypothetical protein
MKRWQREIVALVVSSRVSATGSLQTPGGPPTSSAVAELREWAKKVVSAAKDAQDEGKVVTYALKQFGAAQGSGARGTKLQPYATALIQALKDELLSTPE